ncbi:hypothetical protein ASD37_02435 [Mycobacterium sp. Root135]|nr:hypothetical protein ASD37_02435 [Mycobacterium sp. Root135]
MASSSSRRLADLATMAAFSFAPNVASTADTAAGSLASYRYLASGLKWCRAQAKPMLVSSPTKMVSATVSERSNDLLGPNTSASAPALALSNQCTAGPSPWR